MLVVTLWTLGWVPSPVRAQGQPRATLTSFGVLTDVRRTVGGSAIVPVKRGLGLRPGNVLQTDPNGRAEALLDSPHPWHFVRRTVHVNSWHHTVPVQRSQPTAPL